MALNKMTHNKYPFFLIFKNLKIVQKVKKIVKKSLVVYKMII